MASRVRPPARNRPGKLLAEAHLDIHALKGQYVTRLLEQAATFRGYPRAVRTDNGPEFTSRVFMAWAQAHGICHLLIEPGRPMQNGYIENFNGKFRDECLNEHWFETLSQARTAIAAWRQDYNEVRPHSSCRRMPPAKFAALHSGNAFFPSRRVSKHFASSRVVLALHGCVNRFLRREVAVRWTSDLARIQLRVDGQLSVPYPVSSSQPLVQPPRLPRSCLVFAGCRVWRSTHGSCSGQRRAVWMTARIGISFPSTL